MTLKAVIQDRFIGRNDPAGHLGALLPVLITFVGMPLGQQPPVVSFDRRHVRRFRKPEDFSGSGNFFVLVHFDRHLRPRTLPVTNGPLRKPCRSPALDLLGLSGQQAAGLLIRVFRGPGIDPRVNVPGRLQGTQRIVGQHPVFYRWEKRRASSERPTQKASPIFRCP